jgi:hypothetical protein
MKGRDAKQSTAHSVPLLAPGTANGVSGSPRRSDFREEMGHHNS